MRNLVIIKIKKLQVKVACKEREVEKINDNRRWYFN